MQIESHEVEPGMLGVKLSGRLDAGGVQQIDLKFTALTATKKQYVLVDMSDVSFLASLGIRTLVSSARAQRSRGGGMVLFKPVAAVEEVLKVTGIDKIVPIAHDMDAARGMFASTQRPV